MTSGAGAKKAGWFARLRQGLGRSSARLGDGITCLFTGRKLDDSALEKLEELLIAADLGPALAARLAGGLAKRRFGQEVTPEEVRTELAADIEAILASVAEPLDTEGARPFVVLVTGVNGTGKTTTIGKLAHWLAGRGKRVMLCAGDTFRAAAIEQLKIWGERAHAPVVAGAEGGDPAALAFDAVERARRDGIDVLLIDTAGRLHNKAHLMAELEKIQRVVKKRDPAAPHACLLVLDATTGQNAIAQVETFRDVANVSGLIVTKLDGSARGGIVVALAEKFGLPVHAVGVGEGVEDLRPFEARDFARSLLGLTD